MKPLLLAALCLPASAQSLRTAQATYAASAVADVASSWGREELNPILGRGTFGPRQAATSLAISGGVILLAERVGRNHPRWHKPLAVALYVAAGVRGGVAARNWRTR